MRAHPAPPGPRRAGRSERAAPTQSARVRRYRVEALQDYQVEAGTSLVQARARIVQLEKQCDRLRKVDQRIRQSILKLQADDE